MAIYNREDPRTALPQLEKQLNARIDGLLDFFYPVGCYFETSDTEFNPNKAWGGKWELETEGMVHIGAGDNYTAGDSGGSKDAIVPYHNHSVASVSIGSSGGHSHTVLRHANAGTGSAYVASTTSSAVPSVNVLTGNGAHTHSVPAHNTDYVGTNGNITNANMQPYIVVNRWHRVA